MIETIVGLCPLCDAPGGRAVAQVAYADVWDRMQRDWGVVFSDAVRDANAPATTCSLVRCDGCGLERFEPMAPGDPDFYAELMAETPYAADRWDFALARSTIRPGVDMVDFGCGVGRFLASLGSRTGRTVGVDHNAPAVQAILERGGEAFAGSFESFASAEEANFDVVTTFHTLEHVRDPLVMVSAAARCLKPGGRLLISVPNRERAWREEGEPMDRPPHHVTRWGPQQLRALAARAGLVEEAIRFELPDLSVARALQQRSMEARMGRLPARSGALAAKILARLAVRPRAHANQVATGGYAARGVYGHSMLVVLRKPRRADPPAPTPGPDRPTDR